MTITHQFRFVALHVMLNLSHFIVSCLLFRFQTIKIRFSSVSYIFPTPLLPFPSCKPHQGHLKTILFFSFSIQITKLLYAFCALSASSNCLAGCKITLFYLVASNRIFRSRKIKNLRFEYTFLMHKTIRNLFAEWIQLINGQWSRLHQYSLVTEIKIRVFIFSLFCEKKTEKKGFVNNNGMHVYPREREAERVGNPGDHFVFRLDSLPDKPRLRPC